MFFLVVRMNDKETKEETENPKLSLGKCLLLKSLEKEDVPVIETENVWLKRSKCVCI